MKMYNDGTGKWYVTLYELYPIYEPAEGGYYYEGIRARRSHGFNTRRKAIKKLRKYYRECVVDGEADEKGWRCNDDHTEFGVRGKYIGDGFFVQLERKSGQEESGWVPYC